MTPSGKSDHDGKDHGADRKLDGCRETVEELAQDRLFGDDRTAEIAFRDTGEVKTVLFKKRFIETELGFQFSVAFRFDAPLAGHHLDWVAPAPGESSAKVRSVTPKNVGISKPDASQNESQHDLV